MAIFRIRVPETPTYPFVAFSKMRLNPPNTLCNKPFDSWEGFNNSEQRAGLNDKALKAEMRTEMAIVTANC
jgi:hypothetical protein